MTKIIACGGRNWSNRDSVRRELSLLPKDVLIIHGAATGADSLVEEVAKELGLKTKPFPAEWAKYSRAAGPIRNQAMLKELNGATSMLLVFHTDLPNSKGSKDMVARAVDAGWNIRLIKD